MMLIKIQVTGQAHLLMIKLGHEIQGELICGGKINFMRCGLKGIGKSPSGLLEA